MFVWLGTACTVGSMAGEGDTDGIASATVGETDPGGSSATDGTDDASSADGGHDDCLPLTCEQAGYTCGPLDDCETVVGCGECGNGEICDATTHSCVSVGHACDAAAAECGVITDACGGSVVCATCEPDSGLVCNGATHTCEQPTGDPTEEPHEPVPDDGISSECPSSGYECGEGESLCTGKTIHCGSCPEGMACHDNICGPCLTECPEEAECGEVPDGCGGMIQCGGCPADEVCSGGSGGGGGPPDGGPPDGGPPDIPPGGDDGDDDEDDEDDDAPPNTCCVPKTCEELGAECGNIDDGCGGEAECGPCPADEGCGAQGNANVCEPCQTCEDAQAECGPLDDGCGNELYCGECTNAGEGCGAQGTDNVCEPCKTCETENAECGSAPDGCDGTISCGDCSVGEACTGDLQCCTPQSCAQLGAVCGTEDDGCGNELDCGECPGSQVCTGGGCCQPLTCLGMCGYEGPDGCGGNISCTDCRPEG